MASAKGGPFWPPEFLDMPTNALADQALVRAIYKISSSRHDCPRRNLDRILLPQEWNSAPSFVAEESIPKLHLDSENLPLLYPTRIKPKNETLTLVAGAADALSTH